LHGIGTERLEVNLKRSICIDWTGWTRTEYRDMFPENGKRKPRNPEGS